MGIQQIATLTQIPNATSFTFNYNYTYYRGKDIPKVDSLYPYLLPSTVVKYVQTSGVVDIGDILTIARTVFVFHK